MGSKILEELRTGIAEVEINGKKVPVKPTKEDKWKLMSFQKGDGKSLSEVEYNDQREVLKSILKQGLVAKGETPTEEELDEFMIIYEDEFLMQLAVVFRWLTDLQVKQLKEKLINKAFGDDVKKDEPRKSSEQN